MKNVYRANHPTSNLHAKDVDSAIPVSFLSESEDGILSTTSPQRNWMLNFYKFFSKHEKEFSITCRLALGVLVITPSFAEVELSFTKVV
jgi:hypothetical protein